jgi:hypothetical protein
VVGRRGGSDVASGAQWVGPEGQRCGGCRVVGGGGEDDEEAEGGRTEAVT